MSVARSEGAIVLSGACGSADAETLLGYLLDGPATVDWRTCTSLHTAVAQVLIAGTVTLVGPPAGETLQRLVGPAIERAIAESR